MTFMQFAAKNQHLRQGQAFLLWVKKAFNEDIQDKELFTSASDEEAWNIINLRHNRFLVHLH